MAKNEPTPLAETLASVVSSTPRPTGAHLYAPGDLIYLPQGLFKIDTVGDEFVDGHYPPGYRTRSYKITDLDRRLNGDSFKDGQIIRLIDRRELHIVQVTDVDAHMVLEVGSDGQGGAAQYWRHDRILEWIGGSRYDLITLPDPDDSMASADPAPAEMPDANIKAVVDAKRATDTQEGIIVAEWLTVGHRVRVKKTGQLGVIEDLSKTGIAVRGDGDSWYQATLTPAELEPATEPADDIDTNPFVCPRCHGDEYVDYNGLMGEGEAQRIPCPECQGGKSNPFEAILNSEVIALQYRVERLQAELILERDRARHFEDMLNEALAVEPVALQPAARKVVSTLWQAVGNTRDTKTCDLLDAAIADKLNAGYSILNITVTHQADGKPTHRVITFEADEVIPARRIIDTYTEAEPDADDLNAESRAFWQQAARQKMTAAQRHDLLVERATAKATEAVSRQSIIVLKQLGEAS